MISASPNHFFFGLLLAIIVLAIFIFLPFLTPIVLAAVVAVIFGPIHRLITKIFFGSRDRSSGAALITLLIVATIVCIPALLITGKIYSEVQSMYGYLIDEGSRSQIITVLNNASASISNTFFGLYPSYTFDSFNITSILERVLEWAFANLDKIFSGVSVVALNIFIMFLALFYFLRDGRELKKQIIALSPLPDDDDSAIFRRLEQTVYSIFAGSIAVGILQGILTGIGFAIFHVPSPALWGSIAAVSALIPGIGTALVLVPGILYLFFTGSTMYAVGLVIWGILAVGLVDNFLMPMVVNRGVKIHPFLILLSVLGGLLFFGPIGFILGPIVLAFLFAMLDIYRDRSRIINT